LTFTSLDTFYQLAKYGHIHYTYKANFGTQDFSSVSTLLLFELYLLLRWLHIGAEEKHKEFTLVHLTIKVMFNILRNMLKDISLINTFN